MKLTRKGTMMEIRISTEALHATIFASKDKTRENLGFIELRTIECGDRKLLQVTATNGHIICRVSYPHATQLNKPLYLAASRITQALKGHHKRILQQGAMFDGATLWIDGKGSPTGHKEDVRYPDADRIIPLGGRMGKGTIGMDGDYLASISKFLKVTRHPTPHLRFEMGYDEYSPILITPTTPADLDVDCLFVLMPVKLK